MQSLYNKVQKGEYQKIPVQYSVELNRLIKLMLNTQPHSRPSCSKLLQIPFVIKHMEEAQLVRACEEEEAQNQLMKTIYASPKMSEMRSQLPRANYNALKVRLSRSEPGN